MHGLVFLFLTFFKSVLSWLTSPIYVMIIRILKHEIISLLLETDYRLVLYAETLIMKKKEKMNSVGFVYSK